MGHCDVSHSEFSELVRRFERLLAATGFEEATCPNMRLGPGESFKSYCRYDCVHCHGLGTVLEKKPG